MVHVIQVIDHQVDVRCRGSAWVDSKVQFCLALFDDGETDWVSVGETHFEAEDVSVEPQGAIDIADGNGWCDSSEYGHEDLVLLWSAVTTVDR